MPRGKALAKGIHYSGHESVVKVSSTASMPKMSGRARGLSMSSDSYSSRSSLNVPIDWLRC